MVNWNNLYKIRLNNYDDSLVKHEIVKLLIVKNILNKYSSKKQYQEVYTEYPVCEGKVSDVYHENHLTKEIYAYEIQSKITEQWTKDTDRKYANFNIDWILIDLNKLSNDITELNNQIKELIV
jgi:hypothetical protein